VTLKGKQNHYNVKLLKGYGISINLKDNKVILRNGKNPFSEKHEQEEWFVSRMPYEKIVISGRGYVSTDAIKLLSEKNVNVILTDTYGNPVSTMNGVMSSATSTRYRMGQYDAFRDHDKVKYLRRKLLSDKIESQINFFKNLERLELYQSITKLEQYKKQVCSLSELKDFLVNESRSGHIYLSRYAKLFDPKYKFDSRRGGGGRISNRYASDIINVLLNYGYTVLAGEICKFVNGLGLDAYYGFYHRTHSGFQALVYDIIEPFRWLVEYSVFKFANNHNNLISSKSYTWTREGKVVMDSSLIQRFLEVLERKFLSERPYKFGHGMKGKDGMSMCQEITISKIYVQNMTNFFLE